MNDMSDMSLMSYRIPPSTSILGSVRVLSCLIKTSRPNPEFIIYFGSKNVSVNLDQSIHKQKMAKIHISDAS